MNRMTSEDHQEPPEDGPALLCSECFQDTGLRLDAARFGMPISQPCPSCGSSTGALLDQGRIRWIAHRFFVLGSLTRSHFGGSPRIEFNDQRKNEVEFAAPLQADVELICKSAEVGLFHYGPALWRLGYIAPLESLQDENQRGPVIERILSEYPEVTLKPAEPFFRLRKEVGHPLEPGEYDSPPREFCGSGRLDSADLPILYGSPDLQLCIHECRVTAEDTLHVATLEATTPLRLLDVTALLREDCTEFESLDMAVHMLFLAGSHSYPISRAITVAAKAAGFDGLLFPSYFSLLRTGAPFVETAFGLSTRTFPGTDAYEANKTVPNVGLFGRPIADGSVRVTCINRIYLRQVAYDLGFGPADI